MEEWDFSENKDKKRFYNARIKLWEYILYTYIHIITK